MVTSLPEVYAVIMPHASLCFQYKYVVLSKEFFSACYELLISVPCILSGFKHSLVVENIVLPRLQTLTPLCKKLHQLFTYMSGGVWITSKVKLQENES